MTLPGLSRPTMLVALAALAILSSAAGPTGGSSAPTSRETLPQAPRDPAPHRALTSFVDPFIGTGGHGHTHPAASLPFGMVQVGPDTRMVGWDSSSGYHHSDGKILGFSHTHLSGTGIPDYGDVQLQPIAFADGTDPQAFSHDREFARPGAYEVTFDSGLRVELTATPRVGLHRYTFPLEDTTPHQGVRLDLAHRDEVLDASIRLVGDRAVEGYRFSKSWAQDQRVYFALEFSRPFFQASLTDGEGPISGITEIRGTRPAAWFRFARSGEPLLAKVALSAVSMESAWRNLRAEAPGWDFDGLREAADRAWEQELSKIRVSGGTLAQRRIFYTALYHALLTPNLFMDVDGQYLGRDLRPHRAEGFSYYTVFSLWDTFRALHPLLTIIDTKRTTDFIHTFLRQFEQGGRLPVWELWANETDTMIGYHAVPVIADAWLKGIDGFDHALAWKAMVHSADEERFGIGPYKRYGFVPADEEPESVSKTLEYAYDDWTIAQVAKRLGRTDDYARFLRRAQGWTHLFDPSTGFMRARVDGFWLGPFDPAEVNVHYTEANAWQYSFFVPHDVGGLMAAHGGPEAFAAKLDALFSADSRTTGRDQADITGLIGQYAHGNEPSHHMAYLYAFAGQPWKTQAMVRQIMDTQYHDAPDGLAGNEDCGQMSAWYVLSALGFYPVTPGSSEYVIGSPLFPEAAIALENGRQFTVRANDVSAEHLYIENATLNGQPWSRSVLPHEVIARGGDLVLDMGPAPTTWGSDPADVPRTSIVDHLITPAPFATHGAPVFRGETQVAFGHLDPRAVVRFSTDSSEPASIATRGQPLVLNSSTTLRARAWLEGRPPSPIVEFRAHRVPDGLRITTSQPWAPQYNGGGEDALIDGRAGGLDFCLGRWQGFRVPALVATVELGAPRDIARVTVGALHDPGPWIHAPRGIVVAVSEDGTTWADVGQTTQRLDRAPGPVRADLEVRFEPRRARFVRIEVTGYGQLPSGHPGAREMSWIFLDEITVGR